MTKAKKWLSLFCILIACIFSFSFAACGNDGTQTDVTVTMEPTTLVLYVGETEKLTATADSKISGEVMRWASSDENVATVSASGRVTAKAVGTTTITASYGGAKATCEVTVKSITITMNQSEATLEYVKNHTLQLTATASEEGKELTWSSSDDKVATVDQNGLVTAQGGGEVIISASIGAATAECKVTVIVPEGFYKLTSANNAEVFNDPGHWYYYMASGTAEIGGYYNGTEAVLEVNAADSTQYYLRYQPVMEGYEEGDSYNGTCTVTSSVDGYLRIGGAEGQQEIIAIKANTPTPVTFSNRTYTTGSPLSLALISDPSDKNSYAAGNYTLTSTNIIVARGLEISQKTATLVGVGSTVDLNVETTESVQWTSSDETVATVNSDGLVTAIAAGTAVITATAGDLSAKCNVTVLLRSIELDEASITLNNIGATHKLTAEVSDGSSVTWTSSNTSVATVSSDGTVTAVAPGIATISATTDGEGDYRVTATCDVAVVSDANKITYTYQDGNTALNGQGGTVGGWYKAGNFGTATMKDGVVTLTAEEQYDFGGSFYQVRYLPATPGTEIPGSEEDIYVGTFIMIYTITNNTDRAMTTQAGINGQSASSKVTIDAGESAVIILTFTKSEAEKASQLNIRLSNYGIGTVTISDIYMIPQA